MGVLARLAGALGVSAALSALACGSDVNGPYANTYLLRFDEVWTRFQLYYPFLELKGVDWNAQRERLRDRAHQLRSQDELVALLQELEAPLRDGHLWLIRPDGSILPNRALDDRVGNWDATVSAQYTSRAGWHRPASGWGWGRFGDVGYLMLQSFEANRISARQVEAALDSLAGARALVIDVRMNGGGNSVVSDSIAARFLDGRRLFAYVQRLEGDESRTLSAPLPAYLEARGPRITRPVILLTGRRTFSTAEQFVLELKGLPTVTVMGESTGGSAGYPWNFDLGGGWSYSMSRFILSTPSHQVVEDRGIAPDVGVPASTGDFARGVDPVLDAALARAGTLPSS